MKPQLPSRRASSSNPSSSTTGFFSRSLWRSDGTRQGTGQVTNVRPGGTLRFPDLLAASSDRLFLRAEIEAGTTSLLALDPTLKIERRLDLTEGFPSFFSGSVIFRDGLLWVARPDLLIREVWTSDVTPGGTQKLGTFDSVGALVVSGDRVFFSATTPEYGAELWVSDGTAEGTRLVRDLQPGTASSGPFSLQVVSETLIFSARTASTGAEVWVSDGTAEGTRLLADVNPGPASSNPANFTLLGDRVYFSATRSDVGRELFAIARSSLTLPCVPGGTTLCLNDDRFTVEVEWADFLGTTGSGQAVPLTADTGYFWFFDADNVEAVVKVLDGCGVNGRFWVFAAGLTNVDVSLTVTDTETGEAKTYHNGLGTPFAPVQDTSAFDSCPAGSLRPAQN